MSWAHAVSCLVLVFYLIGWRFGCRGRRVPHIVLMILGMVTDVALTLFLEMARGAVETAAGGATHFDGNRTLLLWVHVPLSLTVLCICYPVSIYLGIRTSRAKGENYVLRRSRHRIWGVVTIALYTASLLTAPRFVVERLLSLM